MSLDKTFINSVCNICGQKGNFNVSDLNNLREDVVCQSCESISRDRLMIYGLQQVLDSKFYLSQMRINKDIKILETSGIRGHPKYLNNIYDYYNILYEPELVKSGNYDIRKYGDLQNMRFQNNYFDVILSSDVIEHVRLYKKGFLEIFRTLKLGGSLILQMPFLGIEKRNLELVDVTGDSDIFIAPPQYHSSNTLVYRIYGGLDLIPLLWRVGFFVKFVEMEVPEHAISWQTMIICMKPVHFRGLNV